MQSTAAALSARRTVLLLKAGMGRPAHPPADDAAGIGVDQKAT